MRQSICYCRHSDDVEESKGKVEESKKRGGEKVSVMKSSFRMKGLATLA